MFGVLNLVFSVLLHCDPLCLFTVRGRPNNAWGQHSVHVNMFQCVVNGPISLIWLGSVGYRLLNVLEGKPIHWHV